MKIKSSIQKILKKISALLPFLAGHGLIKLCQEQTALAAQSSVPLPLMAQCAISIDFRLLFFLSCFGFSQRSGEFSGFLHNSARFIFVIGKVKSGPVCSAFDNFTNNLVISSGLR